MKFHIRFNSLFMKIFLIFLVCLMIPMLVNLFYTGYSASKALESEASTSLTRFAQEKKKEVDNVFNAQFQISNATVNELFMVNFFKHLDQTHKFDPAQYHQLSQNLSMRLSNSNGLYENIFLSYGNKVFVDGIGGRSVGHVFDRQSETYYYQQLQDPGVWTSGYMYSPITKRPVIVISNSIVDRSSNKVLTVLGIAVDINKLTENLVQGTEGEGIHSMILDRSGLVIASNNKEQTLKLKFSKSNGDTVRFYQKMKETGSGVGNFTLDGVHYIGSYVKHDKYGLYLLTYMPVDQYMGKVNHLKVGIIEVIIISVLISAVIVLMYVMKMIDQSDSYRQQLSGFLKVI